MTPTERDRLEDSIQNRTDSAKERLRIAQEVLTHFVQGLGCTDTARRLSLSRVTVWRYRVWLGLEGRTAQPGTKRKPGRLDRVSTIQGVQP